MALSDESVRLANLIPTLSWIPRFSDGGNEAQVTIKRATLNIIPLIATGQTLEAIARDRGLARTLRDVAALVDAGIIWLEEVSPLPRHWATELQRVRVAKSPSL